MPDSVDRHAAANTTSAFERVLQQIETLRQTKHQNVEDLAAMLEPLAQAMAALTDETRQTMIEIDKKTKDQGDRFKSQMDAATQSWIKSAVEAQKAAENLSKAGRRLSWGHYSLVIITGLCTAMLTSAFWLYLAPPKIQNELDPAAVAKLLKPAIEQQKHLKGK